MTLPINADTQPVDVGPMIRADARKLMGGIIVVGKMVGDFKGGL